MEKGVLAVEAARLRTVVPVGRRVARLGEHQRIDGFALCPVRDVRRIEKLFLEIRALAVEMQAGGRPPVKFALPLNVTTELSSA